MYEYQAKNGSCIEVVNMMAGSKDLSKPMVDELDEVYNKAKAFDHIKVIYDKNMNEMSISDTECIEMIGYELERADDER